MAHLDLLPHAPPLRLIDAVDELIPGARCRASRHTRGGDFYLQGHFPGNPVVPACILLEMLAQAGGLAAGAPHDPARAATGQSGAAAGPPDAPAALRVAAFGPCKFPAAAGAGVRLEVDARVVGSIGGLFKIEGNVHADGVLVATGAVTLARVRQP
jgi:3-hydroxyacyl-[acyl-carrier-protein] dehydratase